MILDDLDGIQCGLSPGVSTVSNFENDLANRKIHCCLAVYSVIAPPISSPEFTFDKRFLGSSDIEFWTAQRSMPLDSLLAEFSLWTLTRRWGHGARH